MKGTGAGGGIRGLAIGGLIAWLASAGGCGDDAGSSSGTAGAGGAAGSGGSDVGGSGGGAATSTGGTGGVAGGGSGGVSAGGTGGGVSAGGTGGSAGAAGTTGGSGGTGGTTGAGGTGGGAAVTEVESNNTAATANDFAAIAVNGRVTAAIGAAGDNDFFALAIPAGTTALTITTFSSGVDTLCTTANTTLTLLAADSTTILASNTNISATQLCSHISYAPPAPGTYFVRVNANGATSTFGYILAVRAEVLPSATAETEPNDDGLPSIGNGMASFEGNNFAIPTAGDPISADALITGGLMPAGDEDVFAIRNTGADPAEVYLETFNGGFGACTAGLDTQIRIRDASSAVLAFSDDAGLNRFCTFLPYVIPAGTTVYAHVIDFGDNTTAAAYSLHVSFP